MSYELTELQVNARKTHNFELPISIAWVGMSKISWLQGKTSAPLFMARIDLECYNESILYSII